MPILSSWKIIWLSLMPSWILLLQTDVQRHTIREAIADWAQSVDEAVGDMIEQQSPEEPTLTADEVFGTEV